MKIAISATGNNTDAMVDPRFGRAAWFLIIDTETGQLIEAIDNSTGKEAAHGAGIGAAALVADKGVEAVLTGRVGPKAMPVMEKAGIRAINDVSGSIKEALANFAGKRVEPGSQEADMESENTAASSSGKGCVCGKGGGQGMGRGQGQGRGQCRR